MFKNIGIMASASCRFIFFKYPSQQATFYTSCSVTISIINIKAVEQQNSKPHYTILKACFQSRIFYINLLWDKLSNHITSLNDSFEHRFVVFKVMTLKLNKQHNSPTYFSSQERHKWQKTILFTSLVIKNNKIIDRSDYT